MDFNDRQREVFRKQAAVVKRAENPDDIMAHRKAREIKAGSWTDLGFKRLKKIAKKAKAKVLVCNKKY